MEYAIQTEGLSKAFAGRLVLKDINLRVPRGSIFGFIGPNGAGKTTTIRLLLGLLNPDAGKTQVLGLDSANQGIALRHRVGYVAERSTYYPWMTVHQLLGFNASLYHHWDNSRAQRLLEMFDIHPGTRIKDLSKGMLAQVGLVMALAQRPELLVLDEPTSSLDPVWRRKFLQVLTQEVADGETTVFFSSHILTDVERIADWLAIIIAGRLKVMRPLEDFKHNQRIIRVVFQGQAPQALLDNPGIKGIQRQGQGYLLTVDDNFAAIYQQLQAIPHFALEVVEQDLESIFLDYAGEGREND